MGALIREALNDKLSSTRSVQDRRAQAFAKLLAAKPMPVEDWPEMKRQMIEDMNAGGMNILDTY